MSDSSSLVKVFLTDMTAWASPMFVGSSILSSTSSRTPGLLAMRSFKLSASLRFCSWSWWACRDGSTASLMSVV